MSVGSDIVELRTQVAVSEAWGTGVMYGRTYVTAPKTADTAVTAAGDLALSTAMPTSWYPDGVTAPTATLATAKLQSSKIIDGGGKYSGILVQCQFLAITCTATADTVYAVTRTVNNVAVDPGNTTYETWGIAAADNSAGIPAIDDTLTGTGLTAVKCVQVTRDHSLHGRVLVHALWAMRSVGALLSPLWGSTARATLQRSTTIGVKVLETARFHRRSLFDIGANTVYQSTLRRTRQAVTVPRTVHEVHIVATYSALATYQALDTAYKGKSGTLLTGEGDNVANCKCTYMSLAQDPGNSAWMNVVFYFTEKDSAWATDGLISEGWYAVDGAGHLINRPTATWVPSFFDPTDPAKPPTVWGVKPTWWEAGWGWSETTGPTAGWLALKLRNEDLDVVSGAVAGGNFDFTTPINFFAWNP